jgi:hypothetical protein
MRSVGWKRGVPQTVLEKCGMTMKSVNSKLRSAKRGGFNRVWNEIEERRMRGGLRSAE